MKTRREAGGAFSFPVLFERVVLCFPMHLPLLIPPIAWRIEIVRPNGMVCWT